MTRVITSERDHEYVELSRSFDKAVFRAVLCREQVKKRRRVIVRNELLSFEGQVDFRFTIEFLFDQCPSRAGWRDYKFSDLIHQQLFGFVQLQ